MVKWGKRVLFLISILAVLAGTVYALDWLGVFKVQKLLVKIPGGAKLTELVSKETAPQDKQKGFPAGTPGNSRLSDTKTGKSPDSDSKLQEENRQLKAQVAGLQKQLAALKSEKEAMVQKQLELEQKLLSQADTKDKAAAQSSTESSFKQLARYYAEMKPKEAVAIMDKLDDETVIGILINLENDQTAKILATMDPKRAARLVNKLTM